MRIIKKKSKLLVELLLAVVVAGFLIGLFSYFTSKEASAAWKDDNWHFRKKLVIDASQVSDADTADFTNFPVLVSIDNDSSLKSNAQSDGDDILFTSSDGTTQLDHEIESYTSDTGTLRAWVEVTTLDYNDNTTIYIYYGNSSASSQQNATGTWNTNYVGVWHLNNSNFEDSTTNNLDGTNTSTTDFNPAKIAGGRSFSSSTSDNDNIQVTDNDALDPANAITVEAWVKFNSFPTSTYQVATDHSNPATGIGYNLTYRENFGNEFVFNVYDGTAYGVHSGLASGVSLATNTWYHLVGTYDGSNVRVYYNGTVGGTAQSYTGTIATSVTSLRFGLTPGDAWDLDGSIDEVRISNSARTAGWIATEYNNQNSPGTFFKSVGGEEKSKEPVLYWQFDEGQGTSANDSGQARMTGTLNNTPTWQTEDMCVSGKCLWFDGTNNENVSKSNDALLNFVTGSFSVSAWVKRNGVSSANNVILTKSTANLGTTYTGYKLYMDSSGDLCFDTQDGTNAVDTACTSTVEFDDNNWHYVTGVKSGTTSLALYVDGKSRATDSSIASTATLSNSSIFYVGVDSDGLATEWLGFIDEVKVYDFALSSAQVQANFNSRGSVKGVSAQMGGKDMEWLSQGLVGYWKMDESSWGTVADSSGNGNNGTASCNGGGCSNPSPTAGKFGNGGSFDGTEDYVSVADANTLDMTSDLTISVWFNADTLVSYGPFVNKNGNYILRLGSPGFAGYQLAWWDGTNLQSLITGTPTTGGWHHLVGIVKNNSISAIYLDGTNLGGTVTTSTAERSLGLPALIGGTTGGEYFDGTLDEVRIYNRALSPKEVRDLYNFAPGPVGYWNFEEGSGTAANDTSGNSNAGTLTAGTGGFTTGKYGKGINFDNADTLVNSGSGTTLDDLPASGMTAEAWIYPKGLGENSAGFILAKNVGTTPSSGWILQMAASNALTFTVDGSTDLVRTTATSAVTSNTWNHVVVNWDGVITTASSVHIYVNGVEVTYATTTNGASRVSDATSTFYIGNDSTSAATFNGVIDDVRVYNYARTAKQIVEDMLGSPKPVSGGGGNAGAVGYWKFDEGYGDTANDSSIQNNDGNLAGSGTTCPQSGDSACPSWTNSGKFNKALDFDTAGAIDDYVQIDNTNPDPLYNSTGAMTVSVWTYLERNDGTPNIWNLDTDQATSFVMFIGDGTYQGVNFGSSANFLRLRTANYSRSDFLNTWGHIVLVFDGVNRTAASSYTLFIDGQEAATTTSGDFGSTPNVNRLGISDTSNSGWFWDGLLDEFKIYRYALTEDEVKTEYNRGSSLQMGALGSNSTYAAGAANQEYCVPGDSTSCAAPVGEWKFEEKSGTSAFDTSGNGNTLTLTNSPTYTSGKFGAGINFAGNNAQLTRTDDADFDFAAGGSFTLEAWIKHAAASAQEMILSKFNEAGYKILMENDGDITCGIDYDSTWTPTDSVTSAAATYDDSKWHYVSCVKNANTSLTLYIDGVSVGTPDTSLTNSTLENTDPVYVGIDADGASNDWIGQMDAVKIFNYARTPAQIAWDYNKGKPIAHWKFDECTGGSVYDSSGNSNTGTINLSTTGTQTTAIGTGTCTTSASTPWYNGRTGKRNYSLNFDGTSDYVNVSDNSILDPGSGSFSVAVWAKPVNEDQNRPLVAKRDADSPWGQWNFIVCGNLECGLSGQKLSVLYRDGSNYRYSLSTADVADGNWHHYAMVADQSADKVKLYMDGVELATTTSSVGSWPTIDTPDPLQIGGENGTKFFSGQIDDVKIFNYALTATQVRNEYNQGAVFFGPSSGSP